ncbi:glycosyltransferase [Betaproteobacteria bacterium SCN1]|nr:glycosyltransferase [Betaproteobacteria bacterium SCN1]
MKARLSAWGVGIKLRQALGIRLGRFHQYAPRPCSIAGAPAVMPCEDSPCISLVTPSFNQERFVHDTIKSVIQQNYPHLTYVVQDACSTDGTAQALLAYRNPAIDIRIEPDNGQADALNRGFAHTAGEIMGYLNSDDLLMPGALNTVGRFFRENPSVDVVYGNRLIINEDGLEIGRWILPGHNPRVLRFVDYVPQESMFWRRRIWERAGGQFDPELHFALDWDLILRFLDAGAVFQHLPNLFGIFRVHGKQKSQTDYVVRGASEMAKLRSRHLGTDTCRLRQATLHWQYLSAHRQADKAFCALMSKISPPA